MKVLSIVIPAYNSQSFLENCINSLSFADVLEELDIIIVNDGSTDKTPEIAQSFCNKYPQSVRLISQENRGHGGALNTGCKAAVGKYIKVIDADDTVESKNLKAFIERLQDTESDVVLTNFFTRDISNGKIENWRCYAPKFNVNYTFRDIMTDWKSFDRVLTFHGITYNTAFYRKHFFELSEKVFYEDNEYATFPCCHANSIMPIDIFIYNYRVGDVNQSVSDQNQLKRIGHTETVLNRFISEYKTLHNQLDKYALSYIARKAHGVLMSYLKILLLVDKQRKASRKTVKSMMERFKNDFPEVYEISKKAYKTFLMLNLLHINKSAFEKVLHSKIYNKIMGNHDFE